MLMLDSSRTLIVEGITIFSDHADPEQFWYLPGPVQLGRRRDGQAALTFIKYKPAAVEAGVKGGGFLTFETDLRLDPQTERRIRSRLASLTGGRPRLAPAPFDEGTVQCIALNVQGSGGTVATPAGPGTFNAVETILGATMPSLHGHNTAAFSLTLSQEGVTILEQAFEQETMPVGVLYDLTYTGLRPALNVRITIDYERVYNHFSAAVEGQIYFLRGSIEAGLEFLKQTGAIKIEVKDFTGGEEQQERERWALDFLTEHLLSDWFEPTLTPGQLAGTPATPGGLPPLPGTPGTPGTNPPGGGSSNNPGGGTSTPPTPGGTPPTPGGTPPTPGGTPPTPGGTPPTPGGVPPTPGGAPPVIAAGVPAPAALTVQSREPDPTPPGFDIVHVPATSGTTETLTFPGGANPPTVRVDGQVRPLDPQRQLTLDVAPGTGHDIVVEHAASPATDETFELFFLYDYPQEAGFSSNPPSQSYLRYLANQPSPPDARFTGSQQPGGSPPGVRGADALRHWVQNRLASPRQVTIEGHASYENDDTPTKQQFNQRLSQRRIDIARGIIGTLATVNGTPVAHGHTQARNASPQRIGNPNDRVARITGRTAAGTPAVTIRARIERPEPQQPGPQQPGPQQPNPQQPNPQQPNPQQPQGAPPALSFKLKFIHQEERKTVSFEYDREEAVRRTYAPQGFFGLLARDIEDRDKHFVDVDLDDPFFRVLQVAVEAPIDFARIGLRSAQLALDYGTPADEDHRHADFLFEPEDQADKRFETFLNDRRDTTYRYAVQYHFDPGSGWDGRRFSYELPPRQTEDRTLLLNPFENLGFLEVGVFPRQIDAEIVESVDVHLSYTYADGAVQEKTLTVEPASPPQSWKLRLEDPQARDYTYRLVHHLKDGTTREEGPFTTRATALAINDPFPAALEIDFIPLWIEEPRMVFLDLEYEDPDNNYRREHRFTLPGNQSEPLRVRIALFDPEKKAFRVRQTFVGKNNSLQRGPFVETTETLIAVSDV